MDLRRIEKSDPSQSVQRVGEQNNRKRDETSEEFRRMLHEQKKTSQEAEEDKVELSEAPLQPAPAPKAYPSAAPRYTAADAATSLALLELQVFTATSSDAEPPLKEESTARDTGDTEEKAQELQSEDELLEESAEEAVEDELAQASAT
jgi:hypothetical protein